MKRLEYGSHLDISRGQTLNHMLTRRWSSTAVVPTFLAPGSSFMEDNFSPEGGRGDGSAASQEHYIDCAFNFYYYYITSTSDHQTSGPKVGDPCSRGGTVGRKAGKVRVRSWELWNPPIPGTSEKYCGF